MRLFLWWGDGGGLVGRGGFETCPYGLAGGLVGVLSELGWLQLFGCVAMLVGRVEGAFCGLGTTVRHFCYEKVRIRA